MPKIITQAINFGLKYHPTMVCLAKTPADFLALSNSQIHFTPVHSAANKLLKTTPWNSSTIFIRNPNIKIPEELNSMWEVNEAAQATAIGQAIAKQAVITGTQPEMSRNFVNSDFCTNQKNPDVLSSFTGSSLGFQGKVGFDWKNATAQTQPHGKNQVIIASYEKYHAIMFIYVKEFHQTFPTICIQNITKQLLIYAKNNQFEEQVQYLAANLHKIPTQWIPPLYMNSKFPENTLTPEMQAMVQESKRKFRVLSQKAYENNIPEDNFDQSHIQKLLAEFE